MSKVRVDAKITMANGSPSEIHTDGDFAIVSAGDCTEKP